MFGELFKGSAALSWPLAALILFLVVFVAVVWRALVAKDLADVARLPLDDTEAASRKETSHG
jgi:hypothetical protein